MENEEIIKKYFSLIEKLKRDYFFLNLSSKEYMDIIDKAIKISKEELGDQESFLLYRHLKNNLEILFRQETGREFRNNTFEVLNRYFKTLEVDISSYEVFKSSLNKFFDFLSTYNVKLNSNEVDSLLKNNSQAYFFAKGIFKYLKEIKLTGLGKDINLNTMLFSYYLVDENSLKIDDNAIQNVYSEEEVRKNFAYLINDFKKEFTFLEMDDIDSLIDKAIDDSLKTATNKDDFNNILRQQLEENFLGLSRGALEEKLNETLEVYFNSLNIDISSFSSFSKILRNILYFLNKNNVDLRMADMNSLMKNDDNVKLLGRGIYAYLEQIKKSRIYNNNLRILLEAYFAVYKNTLRLVDTEKKSLYEFYEGYSKDEVDKALMMLSVEEIKLLRERYATDGSYLEDGSTSKEINNLLKKDIPGYLERIVKQEKEEVIYRLFSGIDKSLVDIAFKKLPIGYQKQIEDLKNIYYKKGAETILDNREFRDTIYPKLLNIINKLVDNSLDGLKDQKSLEEIFKGYSKYQIRRVIYALPNKDRELLALKYNQETLKVKTKSEPLTEEEMKCLDELINKKIVALLKEEKKVIRKPLAKKINEYPKEEIQRIVNGLSPENQKLFYLRYDEDLNLRKDYETSNYYKIKNKVSALLGRIVIKLSRGNEKKTGGAKNFYQRLRMYSKEEVDKTISCMSKQDQVLYHSCYDENGDVLTNFYTLDKETKNKINILVAKIKCFLNRKMMNSELEASGLPFKIHTAKNFYNRFGAYSKEEVDLIVKLLPLKDQKILTSVYDKDGYPKDEFYKLNKRDKRYVSNLIVKLMKQLKTGKVCNSNVKNLYGHFSDFSKKEINLRISHLPIEDQQFLASVYDKDGNPKGKFYELSKQDRHLVSNLIVKIRAHLRNGKSCHGNIKNFYNRFGGYSKKEVDIKIKELSLEEQEFLASVYDSSGKMIASALSECSKRRISYLIVKIKNKLKKQEDIQKNQIITEKMTNVDNFYENFKVYDRRHVDEVKKSLPISYQELLNYVYDEKGNLKISKLKLTDTMKRGIAFIIESINDTLKNSWKNEYNKKLVYFIKTNRILNKVNDVLNNDLVMIIIMKYGHLAKSYSDEEIAKIINYNLEEVERLIQLFLKVYQSPKIGFDNSLTSTFSEEIEVHEEDKKLVRIKK